MKAQTIDPAVPAVEDIKAGLCQRLGYADPSLKIPVDISGQIHKALEMAMALVKPRCIYRIAPIEDIDENMIIGKGMRIHSRRWARSANLMDSPEVILVFAVTLGADIDSRLDSVQKESLSLGYILDAAGSEIVERVADGLEEDLWNSLNLKNYQRTVRFSPGYCDWGLDGQKEVFYFLRPERVGIKHTKTWGMLPRKSITAAVLGAWNTPFSSPCPLCNRKSCPYRNEKASQI